jgi:hypothetical protein
LFGASTRAGRCTASITFAMVKVLPVPVAPSSTWSRSPALRFSTSSGIAVRWSPIGSYSETHLNRTPPSDFSGRSGRCGVQVAGTFATRSSTKSAWPRSLTALSSVVSLAMRSL